MAYSNAHEVDSLLRQPGAGFPDFTMTLGGRLVNWVEVKAPNVSVDPLPGPDRERFDRYREALPHIVLTNGWMWRLFESGEETFRAEVPQAWLTGNTDLAGPQAERLVGFLDRITALTPSAAAAYEEAVGLLATAARLVDRAIIDAAQGGFPAALQQAHESFTALLRTNPEDPSVMPLDDFSDALAQTCVFGYLLARVESGQAVTPTTAFDALDAVEHGFLKTALYAVIAPDEELEAALSGVLRTACDAINAASERIAPGGEWRRVPYVYEEFFAAYRPEDRFKFGVFYTPETITRFQVREIRDKLIDEFGLSGLTDPAIRYLDPACGTGTYLLALAEEASVEAGQQGLPVATTMRELFRDRVIGFEVSPGPAAVAQARLTAWLRDHGIRLGARFPIYTVNTLAPPAAAAGGGVGHANLWAEHISLEQQAGDAVKRDQPVLVVFGNPPWGDRPRVTFNTGPRDHDNWIYDWSRDVDAAVIALYDLYVAFWRFGTSMLLERNVQEPRGIVSYITNRSWLRGRAYGSMRSWLRDRNVVADIVDLGGDIRAGATRADEPVFAIKAGSAVSTLLFKGDDQPGTVAFRRVRGTRTEKLAALDARDLGERIALTAEARSSPFGPLDWGTLAQGTPIKEFFSHHYPGVKTHRDHLVIATTRDRLLAQIEAWSALTGDARKAAFHESRDRVAPDIHEVTPEAILAHRYRPLDNRFLYGVRNFIDQPGRIFPFYEEGRTPISLLSMDTRTTTGPAIIATNTLPGYNSFRGSYETHAYPLRRTSEGQLEVGDDALSPAAREWAAEFGATVDDVAAYLLALGHAPLYAETFSEAMETEMVRLPATTDGDAFWSAVEVGRRLLSAWSLEAEPVGSWAQQSPDTPLGNAALIVGERGANEADLVFENGDRLNGVHPKSFDFQVSGHLVLPEFLRARAGLTLTGDLAQEIQRVAGAVSILLAERAVCNVLLERAVAAPMIRLAAAEQ